MMVFLDDEVAKEVSKGRIFGDESKDCKIRRKMRIYNIFGVLKSSKEITGKLMRIPEI